MKGVISKEEKSIDLHTSFPPLETNPESFMGNQTTFDLPLTGRLDEGSLSFVYPWRYGKSLQRIQLLHPPLCPLHLHPYSVVHIQQHSQIAD